MKGMLSVLPFLDPPTYLLTLEEAVNDWDICRRHFYESDVIYPVCVEKKSEEREMIKGSSS